MQTVPVRHGEGGGSKVHLREGVCGKLEHAEVGDGGRVEAAARKQHHRPPRCTAPAQSPAFHTQPITVARCCKSNPLERFRPHHPACIIHCGPKRMRNG